jgi:hypothetical protein
MEKYGRTRQATNVTIIWRMCLSCRITEAWIQTHTQNIQCIPNAFSRQQRLCECSSILRYTCIGIQSLRIPAYLWMDLASVLDVAMLMRTLLWHACETGSPYLILQALCCGVKIRPIWQTFFRREFCTSIIILVYFRQLFVTYTLLFIVITNIQLTSGRTWINMQ